MSQENKQVVLDKIENLNVHISVLETDVQDNPDADVEGKPLRQDVLLDLKNVKAALQEALNSINQ
jgi:hypothetical protein